MQTSEAVKAAMLIAHEYVSPTAWGQLKHDVHVAQQTDRIRKCVAGVGFVQMRDGGVLMSMQAVMTHAESVPAAGVALEMAARLAMGGNDALCGEYLRKSIEASIESIADLNATALDNGEAVPMDFVLGGVAK